MTGNVLLCFLRVSAKRTAAVFPCTNNKRQLDDDDDDDAQTHLHKIHGEEISER